MKDYKKVKYSTQIRRKLIIGLLSKNVKKWISDFHKMKKIFQIFTLNLGSGYFVITILDKNAYFINFQN